MLIDNLGDLSTRDGKAATDFIRGTKQQRGMFIWNDRMYDIPMVELKKQIQSTNYNGIVFVEHNWMQLKKSMEWYERQCNLCAYNQEVILREVNLQRLAGSSMSPFTREQQLYLSSHIHPVKEEVDIRTKDTISTIKLYEKFDRRVPYIIGIDPSEGLSEDNNAMIIINPFSYKVAAEYKCPYISPKDFSKAVTDFMDRYCPHALLVVEANRGRELLQRLSDSHYASRIWYDADRMNQLMSTKTDKYGGMPQSVLARKVQGFVTGTKSRNLLFSCLEGMVMENIDCIFSENLVNELLTLIRKPNTGKIEAAPGEHDDCVMAYLIALYVYLNASNLEEFGISRRMRAPGTEVAKEVETETDYRRRIRANIDMLPEQYRGIFQDFIEERNPIMDARKYARDIRRAEQEDPMMQHARMRRQMAEVDENTISLDQAMNRPKGDQKLGMNYYRMGQQNNPIYNHGSDDDIVIGGMSSDVPDVFSQDERDSYERGIFEMNFGHRDPFDYGSDYDERDTFDPDDYID